MATQLRRCIGPEITAARSDHDHAVVRELCNGFLGWARSHYGDRSWMIDKYYPPQEWAETLATLPKTHAPPDGEILIAWLDGQPIGCVMMHRIADGVCEMKRLFVTEAGRGTGAGRELCQELMRRARGRGYRTMRLDTGRNHYQALSLYNSLGFYVRGPYQDMPEELQSHLVFMEADLAFPGLYAVPDQGASAGSDGAFDNPSGDR